MYLNADATHWSSVHFVRASRAEPCSCVRTMSHVMLICGASIQAPTSDSPETLAMHVSMTRYRPHSTVDKISNHRVPLFEP